MDSRGFDAQVNGAMVSVPQFRLTFGGLYNGQPTIPADWLSAFQSISSVGQFLGGLYDLTGVLTTQSTDILAVPARTLLITSAADGRSSSACYS
jgi:hypothetical protein